MADFPDDLVKGRMGDRGGEKFNADAFRMTADTDETASILRAVDKIVAGTGRGVVTLASHRTSVVDQLGLIPGGVTLEIPDTSIVRVKAGAAFPFITLDEGAAVAGRGIMDGNGQGSGAFDALGSEDNLIYATGAAGVRVEDIRFRDFAGGAVRLDGCTKAVIERIETLDVDVGAWLYEGSGHILRQLVLRRNAIPGNAGASTIRGVRATRCPDGQLLNSYIDGYDMGVELWAGGLVNLANGCHRWKVQSNTILSPWPVSLDASYDIEVIANMLGIVDPDWDLFVLGVEIAGAQRAKVKKNTILCPPTCTTGPRFLVDVEYSGSGVDGDGAHDVEIEGNDLIGGAVAVAHFHGNNTVIRANNFREQTGYSFLNNPVVDGGGATGDACSGIQIVANTFDGAALRAIQARLIDGEIVGNRFDRNGGSAIYHLGLANSGRLVVGLNRCLDNCLTNPFGAGADGGIMINGIYAGTQVDLFGNTSGADLNNGQPDSVFGTIAGEVRGDWRVETPVTMDTGTSTPSVALGRIFDIYSPTPRTITNFLGGYTGKEFRARFIDDNTTLAFAGSTVLRGRFVNRTFAAGEWIHAWWDSDGWEISSSDAAETDEPNTWTKPQNHVTSAGTNAVIVAGVTGDSTNRLQVAPDYIAMGDGGVGGADAILSRIAAGQLGIGGARIATQAAALTNTLPSSISNPPTQAEVQAILDVLAELLPKMQTAGSLG